jgi:hypothetical protein
MPSKISTQVSNDRTLGPSGNRRSRRLTGAQRKLLTLVENAPVYELSQSNKLKGQGVYLLVYRGEFSAYLPIAEANRGGSFTFPIYVGKAWAMSKHRSQKVAAERAGRHRRSIELVENLNLRDFALRFIELPWDRVETTERALIEMYAPLWNLALHGFGNKHPGAGRDGQRKSPFDSLHPGRTFAESLPPGIASDTVLCAEIDAHVRQWLQDVVQLIDPEYYDSVVTTRGHIQYATTRIPRGWTLADLKKSSPPPWRQGSRSRKMGMTVGQLATGSAGV